MNKQTFFIPISVKLIIIISILLLLSLVSLNYLTSYFFQKDSITRIQEVTADKSNILSLKVQSDLIQIIDKSELLALTYGKELGFIDGDVINYNIFRQLQMSRENNILYLAILKGKGEDRELLVDSFNDRIYSSDPIDRSLLREVSLNNSFLDGAPPVSIFNVYPLFNKPLLAMVLPVSDNKSYDDYTMIVYFPMSIFQDAIDSGSEYETYIVNHKGDLIAHKNDSLLEQNVSFINNELVREMLKSPLNNGQMSYIDESGSSQIGAFCKIPTATLRIVTTAQRDIILQAVYQIRRRNIYITVLILILSIVVGYLFAKTLTNPIRRLVMASKHIEKGHFLLDLKASSNDELGTLTSSFIDMGKGLDEREKMKDALGKFVNTEIADMVLEGNLALGGQRSHGAIFFSDIRSFTAISEKLEPEEVVEFLNEYLTVMVECVEKTHGVVDKFIGDALMAIWGTPVHHGNDTENAINGALMMREALSLFNHGRGGDKKPLIQIGCGINTGPVIAGQIGSMNRMEYTVIGDAVNLASRIEGLNKPFGTDILISLDSYVLVKDIFNVEAMDLIKVKGKTEAQQIFAVLGRKDDLSSIQSLEELYSFLGTKPAIDDDSNYTDKEVKHEILKKKICKI